MAPNPFCWIFLLPLHFCFFFYIKVMFKSKAEICSAFKHCLWDSPRRIQTKWIFLACISFNSSYSLFPFPRFLSLFVILSPPPQSYCATFSVFHIFLSQISTFLFFFFFFVFAWVTYINWLFHFCIYFTPNSVYPFMCESNRRTEIEIKLAKGKKGSKEREKGNSKIFFLPLLFPFRFTIRVLFSLH